MSLDEHRATNRDNWDSRVDIHYGSETYGVERFVSDPDHLSDVVAFDRTKLGDVSGKSLLHLQCHIGTDTISWARLGAEVTGIDFSEKAVRAAQRLSESSATPARFLVSELYDTPEVLSETFDVVYTGVGAICWLPDVRGWASVVGTMLKPGGTFYMREGHPLMWSLDWDDPEKKLSLIYSYFEGEPNTFEEETTYAGAGVVDSPKTFDWNHGLGETLTALIDAGLRLDHIEEYDFCEWQAMEEMVLDEERHWRLPPSRPRIPLMWSVLATKI
ncbi:MAG: class I SAM-dependent methyltransferase [Acidimicrobiia bacterium]